MLIDSHCHLGFKDYPPEEIPRILARAREADVGILINIGAGDGISGNDRALALACRHENIFCTVGIHPHDAKIADEKAIEHIRQLALHEKARAIGEIGLDFHYGHSPRDVQQEVFERFIDLALSLKKPVMVHDRGAGDLTHDILRKKGVKPGQVTIHCFTGTTELAKKYLDLGCYLSFTGIITFKKSQALRDIVAFVPLDRILVETDSPFLAPEPFRGKRNEPAYVRYVAETVAKIKNIPLEEVAQITTNNAIKFFEIPLSFIFPGKF